jgi:hypothetical protein
VQHQQKYSIRFICMLLLFLITHCKSVFQKCSKFGGTLFASEGIAAQTFITTGCQKIKEPGMRERERESDIFFFEKTMSNCFGL